MRKKSMYQAALYLRLSKDDEDIDGSIKTISNSIESQEELGKAFLNKQEDIERYDTYIDDGYSGTNFNRPDFKRMLADIQKGHVNCVIVKDLSRFGRDYIEAGRFIQKTFPAFSVRFISINDNYDSLTADDNTTSLIVPVKNFLNDSYSRDISGKVRSQQSVKREMGKFIGAFAFYGYMKNPDNKNQLLKDKYASGIVTKIFEWYIAGMSALAISDMLNELGVLSPMAYKLSHGENYSTGFKTSVNTKWSAVTVLRILSDERYTGTMVQGKNRKVSYKVNRIIKVPEKEWIKVEGTHDAIISKELFEIAQRLFMIDRRAGKNEKKAHIFAGILFCGDCGQPMIRRVNRYKEQEKVYYICSTKNRGEGCSRHSISEEKLKQIVLQMIKNQLAVWLDLEEQFMHIQKTEIDFEQLYAFDHEVERLRGEQEKYLELRSGLYEDFKLGILSKTDFSLFSKMYESQYKEAHEALLKQEKMIRKLFIEGLSCGKKIENMKKALQIPELDRQVLLEFIDKIEVFEENRIHIEFRNQDEFQKMLMLAEIMKPDNKISLGGEQVG